MFGHAHTTLLTLLYFTGPFCVAWVWQVAESAIQGAKSKLCLKVRPFVRSPDLSFVRVFVPNIYS